jgi:hypothetical protein
MKALAGLFSALSILAMVLAFSGISEPQEQPREEEGVEVQARGPIHEAFAQPNDPKQDPSTVIKKQPPEPIEELPPEDKPDAEDVTWVPGYWAWDEDREGFLWVSGIWRVPPPDRQWVPGYWQDADGGWRWVSGYWSMSSTTVEVLPPPPEPVEEAIPPAPNVDQVYVPGVWIHRETRYFWRPGHWIALRPGWVWIPAYYCWTPCGYVFIPGHWDVDLHHRGFCYSPVFIDARFYQRAGWRYRPRYVIQTDFMITSLFINLRRHHYHFGDYYEAGYAQRGYQPWVDFRVRRAAYDPLFSYYRWHNRNQPRWEAELRTVYVDRRDNQKARPPRTLVQQQQTNIQVVVQPAQVKNVPFKLTKVTQAQVTEIQKVTEHVRIVTKERRKVEAAAKAKKEPGGAPIKLELPKSPIKAVPTKKTPPPEPDGPKFQDVKDKTPKDGVKDKTPKDDPFKDKAPKDKTFKDDPFKDKFPKDKTPKDDPFKDKSPKDKKPKDDPFKDKTPKDDPFKDKLPKDGPFKDKKPKDDPFKDKFPKDDPFKDKKSKEKFPKDAPIKDKSPFDGPVKEKPKGPPPKDPEPKEPPPKEKPPKEKPKEKPGKDKDKPEEAARRDVLPREGPRLEAVHDLCFPARKLLFADYAAPGNVHRVTRIGAT